MSDYKFKVTFWPNDSKRISIVDETNFYPNYFMGLDGKVYENYGTKEKPVWDAVYDADYEIEIIPTKTIESHD
jgi:hypothetical protein